MSRRMINQRDYKSVVAVKPMTEKVEILEWNIQRIGKMVFGYVKADIQDEETREFIKIQGCPEPISEFNVDLNVYNDNASSHTSMSGRMTDEGIVLGGRALAAKGTFAISFEYMIGGNR